MADRRGGTGRLGGAPTVGLLLVGTACLLPYLVSGPGHFVDDWFALRNAVTDEWWNAAGSGQWRARPGAGAVYALTFGLIGARPVIHALLAAAIVLATALLLLRVLRRLLPPAVAFAVSVAWLVVPNHTSLEAWPSALNIALALLLLVGGVERLTVDGPNPRDDVVAAVLFGLSALTYEATAPAAVAAVLGAVWLHRADRRRAGRLLVLNGAVLGAAGLWLVANWNDAKSGLDVWIQPTQVLNGHVSTGVVGEHAGAAALGGLVVVVSIVALYLRWRGSHDAAKAWPEQLLLGGWMVVALGTVPFVRYFYSPVGLGDRVTVVSGIGGAAVLVGVVGWIGVRNVVLGAALGGAVLLGAVGHRLSLVHDYATAADDSRRILAAVEQRWPVPPEEPIVFGPYPVVKRNIVAFIDADWPLQWLYRTRDVKAGFTLTRAAFENFAEEQRVDLVSLSHLEALDRITGS